MAAHVPDLASTPRLDSVDDPDSVMVPEPLSEYVLAKDQLSDPVPDIVMVPDDCSATE